jgi:hypothetical protein
MTPEERAAFLQLESKPEPTKTEGDRGGVYLEPGTEDEWEEYHKNEDLGWRNFINKIKNL